MRINFTICVIVGIMFRCATAAIFLVLALVCTTVQVQRFYKKSVPFLCVIVDIMFRCATAIFFIALAVAFDTKALSSGVLPSVLTGGKYSIIFLQL